MGLSTDYGPLGRAFAASTTAKGVGKVQLFDTIRYASTLSLSSLRRAHIPRVQPHLGPYSRPVASHIWQSILFGQIEGPFTDHRTIPKMHPHIRQLFAFCPADQWTSTSPSSDQINTSASISILLPLPGPSSTTHSCRLVSGPDQEIHRQDNFNRQAPVNHILPPLLPSNRASTSPGRSIKLEDGKIKLTSSHALLSLQDLKTCGPNTIMPIRGSQDYSL